MSKLVGTISVAEWSPESFDAMSELAGVALKVAAEAIRYGLAPESQEPYVSLPIIYAGLTNEGPAPADPLTIQLHLPQFQGEGLDVPYLEFTITESITDCLEDLDGDGSGSEGLALLSQALKDLAQKIDSAIHKGAA